jgi:carbamoyltransferase
MNILGISAGFHDAEATVLSPDGEILFAGHSERYSKKKNDADFCQGLLGEVAEYGPEIVAYYERPWNKQFRQWYAGQGIEWDKLTTGQILKKQLGGQIEPKRIHSYNHHLSHAAGGFQTSPFEHATVVVIDAIGEWDTVSMWGAEYDRKGQAQYKRLWRQVYPHSIGLFYSAVTSRIGLHPLDEEYITMGMAAWGRNTWYHDMREHVIASERDIQLKHNFHTGMSEEFLVGASNENIAAAAQLVAEDLIRQVMIRARNLGFSKNLVYMGGVALNCIKTPN